MALWTHQIYSSLLLTWKSAYFEGRYWCHVPASTCDLFALLHLRMITNWWNFYSEDFSLLTNIIERYRQRWWLFLERMYWMWPYGKGWECIQGFLSFTCFFFNCSVSCMTTVMITVKSQWKGLWGVIKNGWRGEQINRRVRSTLSLVEEGTMAFFRAYLNSGIDWLRQVWYSCL
jgi:hypothetical protein